MRAGLIPIKPYVTRILYCSIVQPTRQLDASVFKVTTLRVRSRGSHPTSMTTQNQASLAPYWSFDMQATYETTPPPLFPRVDLSKQN